MSTASTQPEVGLIYKIMPKVISAILPIGKDSKNTQQNYNFRGIDSVYNFIQPILAANGLFVRSEIQDIQRSERPSKSGGVMTFVQLRARYHIVAPDSSSVWSDAVGEAMDSGDKAVPKAQSVAQKYFFLQMFCIPTEDSKDVENDNPEPAPLPKAHDDYKKMASAITDLQRATITKLLADLEEAGKDPEEAIAKVRDYYSEKGVAIDNFPADLTKDQAESIIKSWSAKLKAKK